MNMIKFSFLLSFIISLGLSLSANAQSSHLQLANGMTFTQVLKAWGPPLNKQEFEVKREDLWEYSKYQLVFKNGKLDSWKSNAEMQLASNSSNSEDKNSQKDSDKTNKDQDANNDDKNSGDDAEVDSILNEITGSDADYSENTATPPMTDPSTTTAAIVPKLTKGPNPFDLLRKKVKAVDNGDDDDQGDLESE